MEKNDSCTLKAIINIRKFITFKPDEVNFYNGNSIIGKNKINYNHMFMNNVFFNNISNYKIKKEICNNKYEVIVKLPVSIIDEIDKISLKITT